ncbi:hypothetical protein RHSIM_Rhsim05G0083400 [Rhododendron simsii]|uniref:Uncharacterized protein n=1 Tax=Rhododendron simsii TaxID=118357 RepID=A0A834GWM0_RHOSS|nr:hypothetical protein RHSIM_Rhsim05G0083400 [Rhododendron simsii]
MASHNPHYFPWLLLFPLLGVSNSFAKSEKYKTYIIHMDRSQKPETFSTDESWHQYTLTSLSSFHEDQLLYSYDHVIHGFSTRFTPSQLSEIEKQPAHRATQQESFGKLFTTHTTKFLGLKHKSGIWPAASYGKDVIIGIIDTGIWPDSQSFQDKGMSPVPERWKGKCENGTAFSLSSCNRKLIGAKSFSKGLLASGEKIQKGNFESARDFYDHGTHVSSTATGNPVLGVSYFGYARGTARGVAPSAQIAMYKVAWKTSTDYDFTESDLLAGMDQAIADGVDIMSLSLGYPEIPPYFEDTIAIATLSATEKGIEIGYAMEHLGSQR